MTCNRRKRVVLATWMKSQITSETPKTVTIRNGCSGWVHPHWRGVFYPEKLAVKSCLPFCADHFETAEGNNSFYRIPRIETFDAWRNQVPPRVHHAVKARGGAVGDCWSYTCLFLGDAAAATTRLQAALPRTGLLPRRIVRALDPNEAGCRWLRAAPIGRSHPGLGGNRANAN